MPSTCTILVSFRVTFYVSGLQIRFPFPVYMYYYLWIVNWFDVYFKQYLFGLFGVWSVSVCLEFRSCARYGTQTTKWTRATRHEVRSRYGTSERDSMGNHFIWKPGHNLLFFVASKQFTLKLITTELATKSKNSQCSALLHWIEREWEQDHFLSLKTTIPSPVMMRSKNGNRNGECITSCWWYTSTRNNKEHALYTN
jgi:hypothetical protein